MSQNRDEQKLKALFHDLRGEDEGHAPSFSHAWQAAHGRQRAPRRLAGGAARWVVVGAAAVLIVSAGVYFVSRNASLPQTPLTERSGPVAGATPAPSAAPDSPGNVGSLPPKGVTRVSVAHTRNASVSSHRRETSQATVVLISQWRSPTDFLLAFPADRLLKSLPRLNDSIVEINPVLPEM